MIIDDRHRFAFIHIPKCAGTSVRRQLQQLDSYDGYFYDRREHPELGLIDHCHLPLIYLRTHFPEAFDKLCAYRTFAIVRDPLARFVSAVFERLALFKNITGATVTAKIAIEEAREVGGWLAGRGPFCEAHYIHFARQSDFVGLDGRRIVTDLFAIEDMAGFGAAVEDATGTTFDPGRRENINFASTSPLLSILHKAKPVYARLTSWEQRQSVLKLMNRLKLQSPDDLYQTIFEEPGVRDFVRGYYAADFALHAEAKARAGRSAALA